MLSLGRYKVMQCPYCGHVQVSETNETFTCFSCKKTRKIVSSKTIGFNIRILASFDHPMDATNYIKEYKKRAMEKKTVSTDEFRSF